MPFPVSVPGPGVSTLTLPAPGSPQSQGRAHRPTSAHGDCSQEKALYEPRAFALGMRSWKRNNPSYTFLPRAQLWGGKVSFPRSACITTMRKRMFCFTVAYSFAYSLIKPLRSRWLTLLSGRTGKSRSQPSPRDICLTQLAW